MADTTEQPKTETEPTTNEVPTEEKKEEEVPPTVTEEQQQEPHDDEVEAVQVEVERRHTIASQTGKKVGVKEGYLHKQGGKFKTWKKRYFVLLETSITYFEAPNGKIKGGILNETITGVRASKPNETKKPFAFTIVCGKGRPYVQVGADSADMEAWMEAILKIVPESQLTPVEEPKTEEDTSEVPKKEEDSSEEPKNEEDTATEIPAPTDNFYMHVNKKWLDDPENAIPSEYSSWGGFTKLHDDGLKNQIKLAQSLKEKSERNEEEEKICAIWEASVNRFASWDAGKGDFSPVEAELNQLNDQLKPEVTAENDEDFVNRLATYLHYTQMNKIGSCFDWDKGSDLKNVNHVVLDFSATGLSLPSREYYTEENFAPKRELYKKHLENVAGLVEASASKINLNKTFAEDVIAFEHKLASFTMTQGQSRKYDEYYMNTTLEDMLSGINELTSLDDKEENYSDEDKNFKLSEAQIKNVTAFMEKIHGLFGLRDVMAKNLEKNFPKGDGPECHHITTYDGDAIRRTLGYVLDQSNFRQFVSYMQYKVVSSLRGYCTKALDDEFFDFFSRKLRGQEEQVTNDKRTIGIVNAFAGEMMGKVYVAKYFPAEAKDCVRDMISKVLVVMKESIDDNDWLNKVTKDKAQAKLEKFRVKIGYPDVWKDYSDFTPLLGDSLYQIRKKAFAWSTRVNFFEKLNSVLDRAEWHMTPQTVNAYFSPTQNEIVFPAAILQPPFFHETSATVDFDVKDELAEGGDDLELSSPSNYGGIGAVIAHEITHGYDDQGRKFDGNGNLGDWWTEEDAKLFESKSEIMSSQADKYIFVDTEEDNKEYKMDPKLTMGENMADLGGLSLSLKALKKQLALDGVTDPAKLNAAIRVAFKSWANVWKLSIKKDRRINLLTTDPHAPTDFRGNLVNNMDEFYSAFNVTEKDNMYLSPENRLRMW